MNQLFTLNKLSKLLKDVKGLYAAVLYGSFARNDANPNSDIDIQLLISDSFSVDLFKKLICQNFKSNIVRIQYVSLRNKLVIYFRKQPKLEFGLYTEISDLKRNFLGSNVEDIKSSILFQRKYQGAYPEDFLKKFSREKNRSNSLQLKTNEFIDKFIYEFENCSNMHKRSDAYQFYFYYNIALHTAVQLAKLSRDDDDYIFLPKRYVPKLENDEEREKFYQLNGSFFLPDANKKKRFLLDFFYNSINNLLIKEELEEIKKFCEFIYERDFFWNFRDPNQNNPRFRPAKLYRSATLSLFQDELRFDRLLKLKNIETIIDLRADREVMDSSYSIKTLKKFKYVRTPWDPWNQPDWFKEKYHCGSNSDIAYRFFILGCKNEIKKAIEVILESEGAVAIHCYAGKDRTGIFFSLLHLLVGCTKVELFNDYLASEVDVDRKRLEFVLDIIEELGGIEKYLLSCGLKMNQLSELKEALIYEH